MMAFSKAAGIAARRALSVTGMLAKIFVSYSFLIWSVMCARDVRLPSPMPTTVAMTVLVMMSKMSKVTQRTANDFGNALNGSFDHTT